MLRAPLPEVAQQVVAKTLAPARCRGRRLAGAYAELSRSQRRHAGHQPSIPEAGDVVAWRGHARNYRAILHWQR
jgi:hypothetical protein